VLYDFLTNVYQLQVIQKFFDLGTRVQKDALAAAVESNVVHFSLQIYGCRVVQKVVLHLTSLDMHADYLLYRPSNISQRNNRRGLFAFSNSTSSRVLRMRTVIMLV